MRILGSALVAGVATIASSLVWATPAQAAGSSAENPRSHVIGTTSQGRPIKAYFRGDKKADHVLLVIGQMHGNEKAGVVTAEHARRHLKPRKGTAMWIIPTLNPDGYARGTRTNARGVDLNRNWPTSGWTRKGRGSQTWGGPRKASERETKALVAFLREYRPDYVASLHQPFGVVSDSGEDPRWHRSLSKRLRLPLDQVDVGTPQGKVAPTMVGWFDRYLDSAGTASTIELTRKPSKRYLRGAAKQIMRAAKVL